MTGYELRCHINDALEAWGDQAEVDLPDWWHNPDTVKLLARFVRDRLVERGIKIDS